MATFQKWGEKWRAIVRKKGYRPVSKTFSKKASAQRWAREQERDIESASFTDPKKLQSITIGHLIDRFIEEFEPGRTKKGSLTIMKAGVGRYHLIEFKPTHLVEHCKRRAAKDSVSPATLLPWPRTLDSCPRSCERPARTGISPTPAIRLPTPGWC